jgi:hypothetical protein
MSRGIWKISQKNNPSLGGLSRSFVTKCSAVLSHCATVSLPAVSRQSKLPLCGHCQLHWSLTREQQNLLASQVDYSSSTVFLGKRTGTNLSSSYRTRIFITVTMRARYWTLSWARWIQFKHFNTLFKNRCNIVLVSKAVTYCTFPC